MNSFAAFVFLAVVAGASAGLIAPISSYAGAPIISTYAAAPAYTAYASAPVLSSYAAPALAYSAPVAYGRYAAENTVVAGPSGTISTSRAIDAAAPAFARNYAALPYAYNGLYL